MPKPEKPKPPDSAEQSARFVATATDIGADGNLRAFEAALRIISPPKLPRKTIARKKPKG